MSRDSVTTGTCPRCFTEQPLIWDGTVRPHGDPDNLILDCGGSMHAPHPPARTDGPSYDDLPSIDDPQVRMLVDAWLPWSQTLADLRYRIDANQKFLLARVAVAALRARGES